MPVNFNVLLRIDRWIAVSLLALCGICRRMTTQQSRPTSGLEWDSALRVELAVNLPCPALLFGAVRQAADPSSKLYWPYTRLHNLLACLQTSPLA
jgi:hypothetical protein